jgi:hypothetical protein
VFQRATSVLVASSEAWHLNTVPDFGIARKRCERVHECRFVDFSHAHENNFNVVLCISLIRALFLFATSDEFAGDFHK